MGNQVTEKMMNTVVTRDAGGPDVLELQRRQIPAVEANCVLIKVTATTVSKIDLTERSKHGGIILGHECSGIIEQVGADVKGWKVNEKVCALLPGGQGYAEYVSVLSDMLFSVPQCLSLKFAASFPLLACTTFHAFLLCGLKEGETLLIHEDDYDYGEEGIFALRLAKALYKARVFVVSGDREKLKRYKHYGADACFNLIDGARCYYDVISRTMNRGVDVVINYGGDNVMNCLRCLTPCGNMMVICNVEDKRTAEFSIHDLRESSTIFVVCDPRILMTSASAAYKSRLVRDVTTNVLPLFNDGEIGCEEHKTMLLSKALVAHKLMEERKAKKIILTINDEPPKDWRSMVKSFCSRKRGPPLDSISYKEMKTE